jgi:hypothetical protein
MTRLLRSARGLAAAFAAVRFCLRGAGALDGDRLDLWLGGA